MPESDYSRFWIAAEVFLAVTLVVLPASLGGAPEWTSWLVCAFSSAAMIAWVLGASRNHRRWGWHPVLAIPAFVVAVSLVQLVPLPPGLLAVLSPKVAQLREFALVPLGLTAWRPLAVDAPATARGLARVLSLGMLLFAALELGRLPGVRRRLLSVLALAGAATAAIGFVHLLAGLDSLFGLTHFQGNVPLLTPFGNTNHLAAWLLLTGTIGLGLAIETPTRDQAIGWAVVAGLCGVGVFLSFSRGGIASFVATWLLVGAGVLARRGGGLRSVFPWVLIGGTIVVAGLLSFDQLMDRVDSISSVDKFTSTKLSLWPMFARGLAPYGLVGMGSGGFELGFAPAQALDFSVTYTHPETLLLQWVADVGVPGTLVVLLLCGWGLRGCWRSLKPYVTEQMALVAVLGVGLHELFDFALELNAVAPAATIVVGLLCSVGEGGPRLAVRRRGLVLAISPAAVAVVALAFGLPGYVTAEQRLSTAIRNGQTFPEVRALALPLIDRHPADWVLYANVAQYASSHADPLEALAWINRVLTLRPADAQSHVAAARALLRLGKPVQALGEFKLAWERGDSSSLELGLNVAAKLGQWDRVILDSPRHIESAYSFLRAKGRNDDARLLLDAAVAAPPSDLVAQEASLLLVRHEADLGSPTAALAAIGELPAALRQRADLVMTRVQALEKLSRGDEAVLELERLLVREPSNLAAGLVLVDLLSSLGRPGNGREVLQRTKPFISNSSQRSVVFQKEAALWIQEKRFPRALEALQTASRIEPSRADLHYRMAEVYERMGSLHSALDEVRLGRVLDSPEGAKSRDAWVDRLEGARSAPPPGP